MSRTKLELIGFDKILDHLIEAQKGEALRLAVRQNGAECQQKAQANANFRGHYEGKRFVPPTGATKRNIALDITDDGMTAEIEPKTSYAPYVEYGTRYMEAQPFMGPAYQAQKRIFKADIDKIVG